MTTTPTKVFEWFVKQYQVSDLKSEVMYEDLHFYGSSKQIYTGTNVQVVMDAGQFRGMVDQLAAADQESSLRAAHPALQEAYETYQLMLGLLR